VYWAMSADDYREGLGLQPGCRVDGLILHGCAQESPLAMMHDALTALGHDVGMTAPVSSLPTLRTAAVDGHNLWHARVYGGALVYGLTHLACVLGASCAVFIGTCGGLLDDAEAGDHLVPDAVYADESSTRAYKGPDDDRLHRVDSSLSGELVQALTDTGHPVRRGCTVTTHQAQLAKSWADIKAWCDEGWAAVEMEAASVLAPATAFAIPAAAILVIADNLVARQSEFDPEIRTGRTRRRAALAAAYTASLPVMLARLDAAAASAAEPLPIPEVVL